MKNNFAPLIILFLFIGMGSIESQSIMRFNYRLTDIVYNPIQDRIYGSFSGLYPGGNSILVINPDNGNIEGTIPVRSEPTKVKFSSNYEYLYIAFSDWHGFSRYHLISGTMEEITTFSYSNKSLDGEVSKYFLYGNEFIPIPGQPDDVILSLSNGNIDESETTLVLKDGIGLPDSVNRPDKLCNSLALYKPTSTIYGFGDAVRNEGLVKYTLSSSGIVYDAIYPFLTGHTMELEVIRDRLYCQKGEVFDITGTNPIQIGNMYTNTGRNYYGGVMEYDTLSDKIYILDFVSSPYGYYFYTIDPTDFSLISKVNIWNTSAIHLKKMISVGKPGRLAMIGSPSLNTNLEVWTANLFLINDCGAATPENITISNSAGNSVCKGDTITLTAGGQHDQFIWNNGMRGQQIELAINATITVTVSGFDQDGCKTGTSSSLVITAVDPATLQGSEIQYTICKGDSVTFTASSSNASYYIWSTGEQAQSITVSDTGYYTVLGYRGPGCTDGITKGRLVSFYTDEDIPKPLIDPSGPINLCEGDMVTLTTEPGDHYCEWKHNGNPNKYITVASAGNFQVRYLDGYGCKGLYSDPVNVSLYPPPAIPVLRVKDSLVYLLNNTMEVEWFFNGQQIPRPANDSLVATQYGFFAIRAISPQGCYSKMSGVIMMDSPDLPDPSILQYYVFVDFNSNGVQDGPDFILSDQAILFASHFFQTFTGASGIGTLFLGPGAYDLEARIDTNTWELKLGKDGIHVDLTTTGATAIFSVVPKSAEEKLEIHISFAQARCNTEPYIQLKVVNKGGNYISGDICVEMDDIIVAVKDSGEYILPRPDSLCWRIDSLSPTKTWTHRYYILLPGFEHLGDTMHFPAYFKSEEGGRWELNKEIAFRCAYDPNDKSVSPALGDMGQYALLNEPLEYTIRFQNTGNDTAFHVTLVDYLSNDLNWESFEPLSASHDYRIMLDMLTGKLMVEFDNIMLPDSNVNALGSQGFFDFRILPKPGLSEQTSVFNTSDIFFDLNPPVTTNTVEIQLVTEIPTATQHIQKEEILVSLYPNPYHEAFLLNVTGISEEVIFEAYDALGRNWLSKTITPSSFPLWIQAKEWPNGIFYYQLKDKETLRIKSSGVMMRE